VLKKVLQRRDWKDYKTRNTLETFSIKKSMKDKTNPITSSYFAERGIKTLK